jgi:hypothetical protein
MTYVCPVGMGWELLLVLKAILASKIVTSVLLTYIDGPPQFSPLEFGWKPKSPTSNPLR